MREMPPERCCSCDEPTGRGGYNDDSLYVGDNGPFCEECHADFLIISKDQTIAALTERVRVLEEALRAIRNRRVTEPEEHWNSDQWNEAYQTWILEARGDAAAALAEKGGADA